MAKRVPLRPLFTAGVIIWAAVTLLLDRPCPKLAGLVPAESAQPLKAMPRSPEHVAVLSWILEHSPDAAGLEFLHWSAPCPVSENPFSNGPATFVRVVLRNKCSAGESLEYLAFYLRKFEVLGSISQPHSGAKVVFCS